MCRIVALYGSQRAEGRTIAGGRRPFPYLKNNWAECHNVNSSRHPIFRKRIIELIVKGLWAIRRGSVARKWFEIFLSTLLKSSSHLYNIS